MVKVDSYAGYLSTRDPWFIRMMIMSSSGHTATCPIRFPYFLHSYRRENTSPRVDSSPRIERPSSQSATGLGDTTLCVSCAAALEHKHLVILAAAMVTLGGPGKRFT